MLLAKKIALFVLILYVIICIGAYLLQEKLIFVPNYLDPNHQYQFPQETEELFIEVAPNVKLNCLHFKVPNPKGLIFYLHGNAANLQDWGELGPFYAPMGYEVFMMDYRGYGKSGGKIYSQEQFYKDAEIIYEHVANKIAEDSITIVAFSVGTATGTHLASKYQPKQLILQAPYYSLTYLIKNMHPYLPSFLLKYQFRTKELLPTVKVPVSIFHGSQDEIIPVQNSHKLKEDNPTVNFIEIPNCDHNGIPYTPVFREKIKELL